MSAPLLLIADDVEDSRALYAETFGELGFRTAEAVDGEHALFKIASMMPNLVVMDISMPILDGIEATRKIRNDAKLAHIPVVVLTGHGTPENIQRAKAAGANVVLTKPCTPDTLLGVIRRILKI